MIIYSQQLTIPKAIVTTKHLMPDDADRKFIKQLSMRHQSSPLRPTVVAYLYILCALNIFETKYLLIVYKDIVKKVHDHLPLSLHLLIIS